MLMRLLFGMSLFFSFPSHASTITNLSDYADTLDVWDSDGYKPTVLKPNDSIHFSGEAKIRYAGIEKRLGENESFVIWGNGNFLIQNKR